MTPLRILHSEAATSFGGQEHRIYKEMLAMRERGHHLEAVCQPHALLTERLRAEGFTVHTLDMDGAFNYMKGLPTIRRILKSGRFDVLNTHSRRDTMLAGAAGRLARTPLIVRTRHLAVKVGSLVSYTRIPHRVTTVSEYVRQHLIERGVDPAHVETVYTPVQPAPALHKGILRSELGLTQDDVIVGCVAVMRVPKGHADLLAAMEPLLRKRHTLHLVFVGGGTPVFERMQAAVAEKGLERQVHLMGARNDVPDLLPDFDIFALATHQEAMGTSFVEAAAAGLPAVGTRVGGVPEVIQDGVTGLLAPLHDTAAWTHALETLIDNADLRLKMGREARRSIQEDGKFSTASMVARTEACYLRWLKELKK
jgi:glycosyltransferase involved in cell wall biosynthesis